LFYFNVSSLATVAKLGFLLVALPLVCSCSVTKHLTQDQMLILDEKLTINNTLVKKHPSIELTSTSPNRTILGIPFGLHIYNLASSDPDKKFDSWLNRRPKRAERINKLVSPKQVETIKNYRSTFNNWLLKTGQAPKLIDTMAIEFSKERICSFFNNTGYLDAHVSHNILKTGSNRAELEYIVDTKSQYALDSIKYRSISPEVDLLLRQKQHLSLINTGDPLIFSNLNKERSRIVQFLRNNGIYNYQQNSLRFELQTDSLNQDLNIPVTIDVGGFQNRTSNLAELTLQPYVPYRISKVNIYVDTIEEEIQQIRYTDSVTYDDFKIFSTGKLKYRPKTITNGIQIKIDSLYRDIDRTSTYRYFTSLENFKYPRIDFQPDPANERSLITSVNLVPKDRFRLGFEFDLSRSEIQDFGIGATLSFEVRNALKGAEILRLSLDNTIGASNDIPYPSQEFFNLYDVGANLALQIPRIYFPFGLNRVISSYMLPQTSLHFGTSVQRNIGLDKQFYDAALAYKWSPNNKTRINFSLFDFEYVNNRNVENFFNVYTNTYDRLNTLAGKYQGFSSYKNESGDLEIPKGVLGFLNSLNRPEIEATFEGNDFRDLINLKERYDRLVSNELILGSSVELAISSQEDYTDENFFQIRGSLDWVGTILNDVVLRNSRNAINDKGRFELGGVEPSQYIKLELDFVKRWSLGSNRVLAFRFFNGIAIPFGNSSSIPFAQSYFAGGTNDNRAWRVYSLGPGTNQAQQELNEANFKLLSSLEYRFPIIGNLNGAVFTDAGNIWNLWDEVTDPSLRFDGLKDLSEVALGIGLGLRYDFQFFIFRLDAGFKAHDPAQVKGERWWNGLAMNQAVFNVGINYPF